MISIPGSTCIHETHTRGEAKSTTCIKCPFFLVRFFAVFGSPSSPISVNPRKVQQLSAGRNRSGRHFSLEQCCSVLVGRLRHARHVQLPPRPVLLPQGHQAVVAAVLQHLPALQLSESRMVVRRWAMLMVVILCSRHAWAMPACTAASVRCPARSLPRPAKGLGLAQQDASDGPCPAGRSALK